MRLDSTFKVPVPVDEAWRVTLDYRRLAGCVPGASVDEIKGGDVAGRMRVKLGPAGITYQGKVTVTERDEARRSVVLLAAGREIGGNGTASAQVTAVLTDAGGATEVSVSTDVNIAGSSARFGRGVLADVSERIVAQFAANLARELDSGPVPAPQPVQPAPVRQPPANTATAPPAPAPAPPSVARRLAPALAVIAAVSGVAIARRLLRWREAQNH